MLGEREEGIILMFVVPNVTIAKRLKRSAHEHSNKTRNAPFPGYP